MEVEDIVITGSSGFLGQSLVAAAREMFPKAKLQPVISGRHGGIDLTQPDAASRMLSQIQLQNPGRSVLIHAAALVEWNTHAALLDNAAMALNTAEWARQIGVGFSVLVSSVSVYPRAPFCDNQTPCQPSSLYGAGKMAAEHAWRLVLPADRHAIVRLSGILGWQMHPTLFWNKLLLAAADLLPHERPVVRRAQSRRNYLTAREASVCLLRVGTERLSGAHLAAGRDAVDTAELVAALEALRGSKLPIEWQDDGITDEQIFQPSNELLPALGRFREELALLWSQRPRPGQVVTR